MSTPAPEMNAAIAATSDANDSKFLSFCLGDEEYGIAILNVREIIGVLDITPLPQTPDWIRGVINLRGKIIPVMELRRRFALDSVEYTEETCIIVVEVDDENGSEPFQMGVVVDTVREVLDIAAGSIEPAPRFGCSLDVEFIRGMGKAKDKVITLLDISNVLRHESIDALRDRVDSANEEQAGEMAA